MRLAFFLISLLSCYCVPAQVPPPYIQWQKSYGGSGADVVNDIEATSDGGYITIGSTLSGDGDVPLNRGYWDVWVVKYDNNGDIEWTRTYGSTLNEMGTKVMQVADGGYILLASSNHSNNGDVPAGGHGNYDIWLVKINPTGNIQWSKLYGGSYAEEAMSIAKTNDNGYIISAMTSSNDGDVSGLHGIPFTDNDVWVMRTDQAGNLLWQRCYGGSMPDEIPDLIATADGGFLFTANIASSDGDVAGTLTGQEDSWIVKLDPNGNIQWQKVMGYLYGDVLKSIRQAGDQGYVLAGWAAQPTVAGWQWNDAAWIIKLDAAGNVLWERFYGGSGYDSFYDLHLLGDGSMLVGGVSSSSNGTVCGNKGNTDAWVMKMDASGYRQWQSGYGGTNEDLPAFLAPLAGGDIVFTATTASTDGDVSGNPLPDRDIWLVRLAFPGVPLLPSIAISTATTNVCSGNDVKIGSNITHGGSAPGYRWFVNGVQVPGTSDSLVINTLNDGDSVFAELISNSACVTSPLARSNVLRFVVSPALTPSIIINATDTTICEGTTVTFSSAVTNGGGSPQYEWRVNDLVVSSHPGFTTNALRDGDSVLCVLETTGACVSQPETSSNVIVMSVGKLPVISLMKDTTIFAGDSFRLNPVIQGNILSYRWTPSTGLSNDNTKDPVAFPVVSTSYQLTVTSVNDCGSSIASINIRVMQPIIIPNAFSPNGDGVNDRWAIPALADYPGCRVEVFDRFGRRLFSSVNYNNSWHATVKGYPLPAGVYYYVIEPCQGIKALTGSLTILK